MSYQLLLVEDDAGIREAICDYLTDKSKGEFSVAAAEAMRNAEELIYEKEFDFVGHYAAGRGRLCAL